MADHVGRLFSDEDDAWWVHTSYLKGSLSRSKDPCPWCKRTGFIVEYWTWVPMTDRATNVCKECGDTRTEMQKLGRIVGE